MKLVKLFLSLLMVFTLGISQAISQNCDCYDITNNTDCKLEVKFTCGGGSQTSCKTIQPGESTGFCAGDFGCSTFDGSVGVDFNIICDDGTPCSCGGSFCPSTDFNVACGDDKETTCPNCSNFGPFGYGLNCRNSPNTCEFVVTDERQ